MTVDLKELRRLAAEATRHHVGFTDEDGCCYPCTRCGRSWPWPGTSEEKCPEARLSVGLRDLLELIDAAEERDRLAAELAGARTEHAELAIAAEAYLERLGNEEVDYMPDIFDSLARDDD